MDARMRWCLALAAPLAGAEPVLATRDELIAWTRERLHGGGERGWELARTIAAWSRAVRAAIASETDASHVILLAGKLAQQAYRSWDELAAGYERGRIAAGGEAAITDAVRAAWRELPWHTELDVTIVDPAAQVKPRVLRATCASCGAPRVRPSPTVHATCDYCGAIMDADYTAAIDARVGPAYEAIRARYAGRLDHARVHGDEAAYDELARAVHGELVAAVPEAAPPRAKDPAYRARHVAYLAACDTRAAFDGACHAAEQAMQGAIERLVFVQANGRARVGGEQFRALADAYFAYERTRDAALGELYALHPDGASRELQRRIGWSLFVQGWLPYLAEADAQALIDRAGLSRDYATVDPPELHSASCRHCGAPLAFVAGARRVVCAHCGKLVDLVA